MARWISFVLGTSLVVLTFAGPWGYAHYRASHLRNFRAVRPKVLYRSGQLSANGFKLMLRDHELRTIISLRDGSDPVEKAEEEYCTKLGLKYVRISPREWSSADGQIPASIGVRTFLEVMDDPANHPVLVHCYRGVHRSGAFAAIYRMEYDRWSNDKAIAEMRQLGYKEIEDDYDLLSFLESYKPRWRTE